MAEKKDIRCRKISEITDNLTDKAIEFYDEGKMDDFWASLEALSLVMDIEKGVCYIE